MISSSVQTLCLLMTMMMSVTTDVVDAFNLNCPSKMNNGLNHNIPQSPSSPPLSLSTTKLSSSPSMFLTLSSKSPSALQSTAASDNSDTTTAIETMTEDELDEYAKNIGVVISFSNFGPAYRAVARAAHDEEQIMGYCEGFIRPAGNILHVDKLEVWKKAIDKAKAENPTKFQNGGQVFGISLLLGYKCMLYAQTKKCTLAEFLAIDDEDFQHKRLVRFFKRAGFRVIRYVGEDLKDVPDRLVWGGCGTLMNQEINVLLKTWSKILNR